MPFTPEEEVEYLKTTFGVEDKAAIIEKVAGFDDFSTRFSTLQTKLGAATADELPTKLDELAARAAEPKVNPYKSEFAKAVDDVWEKGITDPTALKEVVNFFDVDADKMDGQTAIKLSKKIQNKWDDSKANLYYNSNFVIDPTDETIEDKVKLEVEEKLIREEQGARAFLKNYIGKKFEVPVDAARQQQDENKRQLTDFWTGKAPSIVSQFKELKGERISKIPNGEKGEVELKAEYGFTIPDNDLKEITNLAVQVAVNSGVPNTEEGAKQVGDWVREFAESKYRNQLAEKRSDAQETKFIEFMQNEFHNNGQVKGGQFQNRSEQPVDGSREDVIYKKAAAVRKTN